MIKYRKASKYYETDYGYQTSAEIDNFDFSTKFVQKRYFWSKEHHLNITTEFRVFDLAKLKFYQIMHFQIYQILHIQILRIRMDQIYQKEYL